MLGISKMILVKSSALTERQYQVFVFLRLFARTHGFPPTMREIGGHFRIAPSSVLDQLRALERKGFIRREPMKSRCVEILR